MRHLSAAFRTNSAKGMPAPSCRGSPSLTRSLPAVRYEKRTEETKNAFIWKSAGYARGNRPVDHRTRLASNSVRSHSAAVSSTSGCSATSSCRVFDSLFILSRKVWNKTYKPGITKIPRKLAATIPAKDGGSDGSNRRRTGAGRDNAATVPQAVGQHERPLWVESGLSRRNIRDLAASLKTPRFSASNRRLKVRLLLDSRAPHRTRNAALHPLGHAPLPVDRRFLLEHLQGDVPPPRAR